MLDQEFIKAYLSEEEIASMSRADALRIARLRDFLAAADLEDDLLENDHEDDFRQDDGEDQAVRDWDLVEDDYPWEGDNLWDNVPLGRIGWD